MLLVLVVARRSHLDFLHLGNHRLVAEIQENACHKEHSRSAKEESHYVEGLFVNQILLLLERLQVNWLIHRFHYLSRKGVDQLIGVLGLSLLNQEDRVYKVVRNNFKKIATVVERRTA